MEPKFPSASCSASHDTAWLHANHTIYMRSRPHAKCTKTLNRTSPNVKYAINLQLPKVVTLMKTLQLLGSHISPLESI